MHTRYFQQAYPLTSVILDKNINIAVLGLLASRVRTKEPCLQDRLSLEIFGNLILCKHLHKMAYVNNYIMSTSATFLQNVV